MTKKKVKIADDILVAAADIAIDGKHFDRGSPIEGVDLEQVALARGARRVITYGELMNRAGEPAPEPESSELPEPELSSPDDSDQESEV